MNDKILTKKSAEQRESKYKNVGEPKSCILYSQSKSPRIVENPEVPPKEVWQLTLQDWEAREGRKEDNGDIFKGALLQISRTDKRHKLTKRQTYTKRTGCSTPKHTLTNLEAPRTKEKCDEQPGRHRQTRKGWVLCWGRPAKDEKSTLNVMKGEKENSPPSFA